MAEARTAGKAAAGGQAKPSPAGGLPAGAALPEEEEEEAGEEAQPRARLLDLTGGASYLISCTLHAILLLLLSVIVLSGEVLKPETVSPVVLVPKRPPPEVSKDLPITMEDNPVPVDSQQRTDTPVQVVRAENVEEEISLKLPDPETEVAVAAGDAPLSDIPLPGLGVEVVGVGGGGNPGGGSGNPGQGGTGGGPGQGAYGNRRGNRLATAKQFGGDEATESALAAALDWLKRHQHPDGHFSCSAFDEQCQGGERCNNTGSQQGDVAMTGLAMMAFMGAGSTHHEGPFADQVRRAWYWLREQQQEDGCITDQKNRRKPLMYNHGIGTLAACELYGMTGDGDVRDVAQKAIDFTVQAQHDTTGGWRYMPEDPGDTSVVGWQVMSCKSARIAGLTVPDRTFQMAEHWFQRVTAGDYGPTGYRSAPGSRSEDGEDDGAFRPSTTAIGMACRQFLGTSPSHQYMIRNADRLLRDAPPRWEGGGRAGHFAGFYYWYYATMAMFQMGGEQWDAWNRAMKQVLLDNQSKSGCSRGSWGPADHDAGGRIMWTALGAMILEVYYRYMPIYREDEG